MRLGRGKGEYKMIKKKIISVFAAATMLMAATTNAFALGYGEEWGTPTQTSEPTTISTPAPAPVQSASTGTYKDVPSTHWAYKAVERCSATKWFSGYPDGNFKPDGQITRAEAMKVFVTFLGEALPDNLTSTSYYDVPLSAWYAPYIEAGKDLFPQRTSMTSQQKFQPEMPVTREDTVYALVKALNYDSIAKNADESVLNMFSDQNSISGICKQYMAVAVSNGLVSGYSDGTIGAQDPLTRAQFATLLYRATFIGALPETEKKLVKVDIEPATLKEITVGESFEIKATATYSDGSTEDYTSKLNPYTDSQEGIVNINKNKVTGVSAGTILINYNDEQVADKNLVVVVKADPNAVAPEPTAEPDPEPAPVDPAKAGVVKAKVDKEEMPASVAKRYTVLVLDESGSMYGSPVDSLKTAAKNFCTTVLNNNSEDYIAIVSYESDEKILCNFTKDASALTTAIDTMYANGGTNIYDALNAAEGLLDSATDSDILAKSIVLMTDGYPCVGPESQSGKYTANDLGYFYTYGNTIYDKSQEIIAKNYDLYTIGFGVDVEGERLLTDIQNKGYYHTGDVDKLYDVFKKIANTIIVSGVNVELRDGSLIVDSCSTNKGACEFSFTVNPGKYQLIVSAPGYTSQTQDIEIKSGDTVDLGDIVLSLE